MRRNNLLYNLDWITVILFLVMIVFGWMNIFSVEYTGDSTRIIDLDTRSGKQFLFILTALLMAMVLLIIDHRFYEYFGFFFYFAILALLFFVLILGKEINGAKSWFEFGSFRLQPSEFAKPAVALALAGYLSAHNLDVKSLRTILRALVIIFTPALLIMLQPDMGSAMVFFIFILAAYREGFPGFILLILLALVVISLLVLLLPAELVLLILIFAGFIAWGFISHRFKEFMITLLIFALLLGVSYALQKFVFPELSNYLAIVFTSLVAALIYSVRAFLKRSRKPILILSVVFLASIYSFSVDYAFSTFLSEYQQRRVNILLGFESDPQGAGYNVNQSKIAIGSGGLTGKGYLQGTQTKLNFVPEQSTDFIFCTVGEEWGFIGSFLLVILFMGFLLRLLFLAERQRSKFARIFGYSVLSVFFIHFFVNIAMTIGLFPVIGIPLPFFSYGGSSLWSFTLMLFIFLRLDSGRKDYIR